MALSSLMPCSATTLEKPPQTPPGVFEVPIHSRVGIGYVHCDYFGGEMSEMYHERRQPLSPRTPVERVYTANGPVYVPITSDVQPCQPIRRETMRVIRRQVLTADGRAGIEVVEEHDVVYGPPRVQEGREPDLVRTCLAGIVAFLVVCVAFTAFGGGAQSMALIPAYWGAVAALWWALA
jgi:hypothetical protein